MKRFPGTIWVAATAMLWAAAAAVAAPITPAQPAAPAIQVYAAGSLRTALTRIAHAYEARTGQQITLTFGSSGLLRQRIQHGSDADVFASADMGQPGQLARGGDWRAPVVFARSRLCLLTRGGLDVTPATVLPTLLRPDVRIGTSTPGADPSGDYTWQMFRRADQLQAGAYATLDAKAIKLVGAHQHTQAPAGQNPVAWSLAHGSIDVFVSYCNSARALQRQQPGLQVVELPPALAVAAAYGMTVRKNAPAAAKAFAASLLSADAQRALQAAGFSAP